MIYFLLGENTKECKERTWFCTQHIFSSTFFLQVLSSQFHLTIYLLSTNNSNKSSTYYHNKHNSITAWDWVQVMSIIMFVSSFLSSLQNETFDLPSAANTSTRTISCYSYTYSHRTDPKFSFWASSGFDFGTLLCTGDRWGRCGEFADDKRGMISSAVVVV